MQLKNKESVIVNYNDTRFKALVQGIATIEFPIMGRMIIIEPYSDERFGELPNDILQYDFSCIMVPESSLKKDRS